MENMDKGLTVQKLGPWKLAENTPKAKMPKNLYAQILMRKDFIGRPSSMVRSITEIEANQSVIYLEI